MKVLSLVFVFVSVVIASGVGWLYGQADAPQGSTSWPQSQATFPQPSGWGGSYWGPPHASTAEQGMMMGMADMMQAAGARNLMNAQALGFVEDARRKNIDNRMYGTEAYFHTRKVNREARAAEAGPPVTQADLERFARARAPQPLSPSELDPLTGAIAWPVIFRDAEYAEYRDILERLHSQRASVGYLSGRERGGMAQTLEAMEAELRRNLPNYVPQDYVQARRFLDGLRRELIAPTS